MISSRLENLRKKTRFFSNNSTERARGYLQRFKEAGNIDTAVQLLNRAIQIDSDYTLAYLGLAEAYFWKYSLTKEEKFADEAIKYCNETLRGGKNSPGSHPAAADRIKQIAGRSLKVGGNNRILGKKITGRKN